MKEEKKEEVEAKAEEAADDFLARIGDDVRHGLELVEFVRHGSCRFR